MYALRKLILGFTVVDLGGRGGEAPNAACARFFIAAPPAGSPPRLFIGGASIPSTIFRGTLH
jgi:hypothetical protein